VAREHVFIDAGLVVEAIEIAGGDELNEVAIAGFVFAEQDEGVVAVGIALDALALLSDVDFAADDGMDAVFLGFVVELDCAEEIAVVGHGDGRHFLLFGECHEL
jgi:hypothetical protein